MGLRISFLGCWKGSKFVWIGLCINTLEYSNILVCLGKKALTVNVIVRKLGWLSLLFRSIFL